MEQQISSNSLPDPLDQYPVLDLISLKALNTATQGFRADFGHRLYQQIGQKRELLRCAYCEFPGDDFKGWLMMSLDHVIPISAAKALEIDKNLWDSVLNLVFCCRVCNDFNRGVKSSEAEALKILPYQPESRASPEEFLRLRKATFPRRLEHIIQEREKALLIYQSPRWVPDI